MTKEINNEYRLVMELIGYDHRLLEPYLLGLKKTQETHKRYEDKHIMFSIKCAELFILQHKNSKYEGDAKLCAH